MNREEKRIEIGALNDTFTKAKVAICTDFKGMSVAKVTAFRKSLREKGASARVVRNTLAKLSASQAFAASDQGEVGRFVSAIKGTTMVIYSDVDPVSPAKALTDLKKDLPDLQVRGGWFDGKFIDSAGVEELSKMPSREELLSTLLRLINTPATQLLRVLSVPSEQAVQVIEAHRLNLEKGGN